MHNIVVNSGNVANIKFCNYTIVTDSIAVIEARSPQSRCEYSLTKGLVTPRNTESRIYNGSFNIQTYIFPICSIKCVKAYQ